MGDGAHGDLDQAEGAARHEGGFGFFWIREEAREAGDDEKDPVADECGAGFQFHRGKESRISRWMQWNFFRRGAVVDA